MQQTELIQRIECEEAGEEGLGAGERSGYVGVFSYRGFLDLYTESFMSI